MTVRWPGNAINDFGGEGHLSESLAMLPPLLRWVFGESVSMQEVAALPALKGWTFFDGQSNASPERERSLDYGSKLFRKKSKNLLQEGRMDLDTISAMKTANFKRAVSSVSNVSCDSSW